MIYYLTQKNNQNKHPLIPDDYPWQVSSTPSEGWIAVTEQEYNSIVSSFDLSEYNSSINNSQSDIEEKLQLQAASFVGVGKVLADDLKKKVWARNAFLKSIGQELSAQEFNSLLNISIQVDLALTTGSLVTAKNAFIQMRPMFPKYDDISEWAIKSLSSFV